jgi:hypothetical protein
MPPLTGYARYYIAGGIIRVMLLAGAASRNEVDIDTISPGAVILLLIGCLQIERSFNKHCENYHYLCHYKV